MYCPNCGNRNYENADVCINCGTLLKKEDMRILDKPNTGLNVLSFLWPFVGLILYLSMKEKTPIKAKKCGKFALIGLIINVVILILVFTLVFTLLNKVGNSDIAKFSNEIESMAIEKFEADNYSYSKCYNISEIVNNNNGYYGSVRVTKTEKGYFVKTYISKDNSYLVSEYSNSKRKSFNIKTELNTKINDNCYEY